MTCFFLSSIQEPSITTIHQNSILTSRAPGPPKDTESTLFRCELGKRLSEFHCDSEPRCRESGCAFELGFNHLGGKNHSEASTDYFGAKI